MMILEQSDGSLASDVYLSEEWNLACRVAASKGLSRSSLLPKFLLYICEQSLKGHARLLTEQHIGISIFHRRPDYNPGQDNIVRSYARILRRRLEEYFETEGRAETMRIVIARGGYVPAFERTASDPSLVSTSPSPETSAVRDIARPASAVPEKRSGLVTGPSLRSIWTMVLTSFLAGAVLVGSIWLALRPVREKRAQSPSHPIWAEMFQPNRNTLIVPADSGFGILQNLTGHLITLQDYVNGSHLSENTSLPGVNAANLADLRHQRYTSMVDLNITARIMELPERATGRAEIRYARGLTTEDLKTSNAILLGSIHSNPWVALFQDKLNFQLVYMPEIDQSFVLDQRPVGNEQTRYVNGTGRMANQTYGVVDYLPNLAGNGHVLIIQGLNMAATQAAADTLFSSDAMKPILKKALRSNGTVMPFELLIKTSSIGATDPGLQIIASRFYS